MAAEVGSNYELTIKRIVNDDFRFSKETEGLYELYYEWIKKKSANNRSEEDKKYLELYPHLPKKKRKVQIEEEEMRTHDPKFWEDQKAAEAQMKKVKDLKKWVEKYEDVENACGEASLSYDFYKEEAVTEEDVDTAYAQALDNCISR